MVLELDAVVDVVVFDDEYWSRLNYRYRMRYRVTDEQALEIDVFYIGHRRDAYR